MIKMQELETSVADDRRQYVRVHDAVGLQVQRLTELPAAGLPGKAANAVSSVRQHDKYSMVGYAQVRRDHPAVANYIDELEERIRQLMLDSKDAVATPTHKVSLSAGGINFSDKTLLHPGELVAISLTLFPSGRRISVDAQILSGNDAPEVSKCDEPSYRATFIRLSDADRQALQMHVEAILHKRVYLDD